MAPLAKYWGPEPPAPQDRRPCCIVKKSKCSWLCSTLPAGFAWSVRQSVVCCDRIWRHSSQTVSYPSNRLRWSVHAQQTQVYHANDTQQLDINYSNTISKTAVVRHVEFSKYEIRSNRPWLLPDLMRHRTKFCENGTISCHVVAKTTFYNSYSPTAILNLQVFEFLVAGFLLLP